MGTWDELATLPLVVEGYALEGLQRDVSSDFTRLSTVIHLRGAGEEGVGEDVTYDALDHVALQEAGPGARPGAARDARRVLRRAIGGLDLFPAEPVRDVSRLYRRWAFECAALDLALRQAGTSLARGPRPRAAAGDVRGLAAAGEPATLEPVRARLERYPSLRFKLDPTSDWTDELIAELVETGAVDSVDFKGHYRGTVVDQPSRTPTSTGGWPRRSRRRGWRTPTLNDETDAGAGAARATASPGMRRSIRSPTSRRCPSRRRW